MLLLAAATGCSTAPASAGAVAVAPGHVIIGRAAAGSDVALLTNAPALVRIGIDGRISRVPVRHAPGKLWGLGTIGADVYSVAGFVDLVRIGAGGEARAAARFARPIGNLLDTAEGMAAQRVVDSPGQPLLWTSDANGALGGVPGLARRALALTPAEEGLLHLLSCSLPPDVLCWLPGSAEVLTATAAGLSSLAVLESVQPIAPRELLNAPTRRVIHDAVWVSAGAIVALVSDTPEPALYEFDARGRRTRRLHSPVSLRALLRAKGDRVQALARDGRLVEVRR